VHGAPFLDHERAYPRLIMMVLPVGLRGVLVASFFAAFLSTLSTQLNWGASYLLHDGYKRFLRRDASERHYLVIAKVLPFLLALGAMGVAFANESIGASFTWILNLTAGVGPVYLLRWFWWRINPWSEIAAMSASPLVLWVRPHVLAESAGLLPNLLFMVAGTACVWLPATLMTPPAGQDTLQKFYRLVRPPGWWRPVGVINNEGASWRGSLLQWLVGTVALLATTIGPLQLMVGPRPIGWTMCGIAVLAWAVVLASVVRNVGRMTHENQSPQTPLSPEQRVPPEPANAVSCWSIAWSI
jgi:hypothetical protein